MAVTIERIERLYFALNDLAGEVAKRGNHVKAARIDAIMGKLEIMAWRIGCRAEWVGDFSEH